MIKFGIQIERLLPPVSDRPARAWKRPKAKARWRQAEDYFRRERDRKLKPTLARLEFMERAGG